jgi:hypothetical protein
MSERKAHFRIRKGEIEIEYEGSSNDVNKKYEEAFEWLKTIPSKRTKKEKEDKEEKDEKEEKKRGTRGPAIWSPAIDSLIQEGFFKLPNSRTRKDVEKELEDKALPVKGKSGQIVTTLRRKVRKGDLKGTKGPEGWTFWTE